MGEFPRWFFPVVLTLAAIGAIALVVGLAWLVLHVRVVIV